jgi:hypothetical protein
MDKKSILIGALGASLLFVSIGAGTNSAIQTLTPESHVWEFHVSNPSASDKSGMAFAINKKTGEVRKYNSYSSRESTQDPWNTFEVCKKRN